MRLLRDYLISFAAIGILGALLFNNVILPLYVNWNDEIRVPSLTHTDINQANKLLKERNLEWTIKDTIFRRDIPSGFIMDQFPEAGQMVKEYRKIQLTIALPPEKEEMPELIAKTERQAQIALDRMGLVLAQVLGDSSDFYEKTVVMGQSIAAGLPVAPGDSVVLTISLGKRNLKKLMPDLLNKSLDVASSLLQAEGFLLGEVRETQNPELLPNTVVSQSVPSGKIFSREREVTVDLIITTE
jgi:beta-lactam-binding protein with PASTA domain